MIAMSQTAGLTCLYKSIKHTYVGREDLLVAGSVTSFHEAICRLCITWTVEYDALLN